MLRSAISKNLKSGRRAANRLGDSDLERRINQALRACVELASIIERANGARIIADYSPEIGVGFNGGARFSLNGVEITEAHEWYGRVRVLTSQILSAWRQVNV
jgi:outer membrane protein TolC